MRSPAVASIAMLLWSGTARAEPPAPSDESRWYGGRVLLTGLGWYLAASALTRNTSDPYRIATVSLPALAIGPIFHVVERQPANLRASLITDAVVLGLGMLGGAGLCALTITHPDEPENPRTGCVLYGTVLSLAAPFWDGLVIAYRRPASPVALLPLSVANAVGLAAAGRF
jgi:hypothetical protein